MSKRSNVHALKGIPEVSSSGVTRKNNKRAPPKLVATKENSFKRQMIVGFAAVKNMVIGLGIYAMWEELTYFDPMQHYVVCAFAVVVATEAVVFKLSKIQ